MQFPIKCDCGYSISVMNVCVLVNGYFISLVIYLDTSKWILLSVEFKEN